jgi:hypothetical protein
MSNKTTVKAFKKHITLLGIITFLIIPIVNDFGLTVFLTTIKGNIMYEDLFAFFQTFSTSLDTLNLFLGYGLLASAIVRFGTKHSKDVIVLSFLRVFVRYASYFIVGAIASTDLAAAIKNNLYFGLINGGIDVMLVLGAIFLCSLIRSRYVGENKIDITIKKVFNIKNPMICVIMWVCALVGAFLLAGCVIDTVLDIMNAGADNLNANEIVYLVSPYVKWLFKVAFGYFVMIFTSKWLDFQWKALNAEPKSK